MFNYIKSEFFRLSRSLSTYVTLAIFVVLSLSINCGLAIIGALNADFAYADTGFSMLFLLQIPQIFVYAAALVVYIIYDGNVRSGNLKNAIAFGISRDKLLLGQFIVSLVSAVLLLVITEAVYMACAYAFLGYNPYFTAADVATETLASMPAAIASLVLALVVVHMSDKGFIGIIIWFVIFLIVPSVCELIGKQVEFFARAAQWMPMNFMRMQESDGGSAIFFWQTENGILKSLVSGAVGTLIFGAFGWLALRRKEV